MGLLAIWGLVSGFFSGLWRTKAGRYLIGVAAALSVLWVYGAWCDHNGAQRVRTQWAAANEEVRQRLLSSDQNHAEAGEQKARDLARELLEPIEKLKERSDALEAALLTRPGCSTDDVLGLDGLPRRDAGSGPPAPTHAP